MVDLDIIPTPDLNRLYFDSIKHLNDLKEQVSMYEKISQSYAHACINRSEGKCQMPFEDWDESKIDKDWETKIS